MHIQITFQALNIIKLHEISFSVLTIIILFIQNKLKGKTDFIFWKYLKVKTDVQNIGFL